jgi:hypothetical protein
MSIFAMRLEENSVARRDFTCGPATPAAWRYSPRSAAPRHASVSLACGSSARLILEIKVSQFLPGVPTCFVVSDSVMRCGITRISRR